MQSSFRGIIVSYFQYNAERECMHMNESTNNVSRLTLNELSEYRTAQELLLRDFCELIPSQIKKCRIFPCSIVGDF